MEIILASKSPRRADILSHSGLTFSVRHSEFDETRITSDIKASNAEIIACELARGKAMAVAALYSESVVIGADTDVWLDDAMLGKPRDLREAADMFRTLSGRAHKVVTGVAVVKDGRVWQEAKTSTVVFARWEKQEIEGYIGAFRPLDKAGAYGIQELPTDKFRCETGDEDNVAGLPLELTLKLINSALGAE